MEKTPNAGNMYINKDKVTGEVTNFTLNIRPESLKGLKVDAYGMVKLIGFKNKFLDKNPKSPHVNFLIPTEGGAKPKPTFKKPEESFSL